MFLRKTKLWIGLLTVVGCSSAFGQIYDYGSFYVLTGEEARIEPEEAITYYCKSSAYVVSEREYDYDDFTESYHALEYTLSDGTKQFLVTYGDQELQDSEDFVRIDCGLVP